MPHDPKADPTDHESASAMGKHKPKMELREVSVRPIQNGFLVRCAHAAAKGEPMMMFGQDDEDQYAKTADEAGRLVVKALGKG